MSEFAPAIAVVLEHEGGYFDDPRGGPTKYGISQRSYPNLVIRDLEQKDAEVIYLNDWWRKYEYQRIESQTVATKVLDAAVNMGARPAHRCAQRATRAVRQRHIAEDGILGPISVNAINESDECCLLAAYRSELAAHYRMIGDSRFERGWLNRAYS
jgi:lysozyme family protein